MVARYLNNDKKEKNK